MKELNAHWNAFRCLFLINKSKANFTVQDCVDAHDSRILILKSAGANIQLENDKILDKAKQSGPTNKQFSDNFETTVEINFYIVMIYTFVK